MSFVFRASDFGAIAEGEADVVCSVNRRMNTAPGPSAADQLNVSKDRSHYFAMNQK